MDDEILSGFSLVTQTSHASLKERKTWCQKTFGKMQSGSVRGSIFTLAATSLGAGFLAIPKVLQWSGIIPGLLIISFSGLLTFFSLHVISKSCSNHDKYHYGTVTQIILGRFWGILLQTTVIIDSLGLMIVYNIIVGNLIPSILSSVNIQYERKKESEVILLIFNFIFVLPLGVQRKLTSLRYEALFKLISLTYILIILIVQLPFFIPQNNYQKIQYYNFDHNFFRAFASSLFAFMCQQNLTRVQSELKKKSFKRMEKVNIRSTVLMDVLLSAISLFGYFSLLQNIPDIIITREAPQSISNDWAMVLARVLVSISITIGIAINLIACRFQIEKLVFNVQDKSSLKLHVSLTLILIAVAYCVAVIYPDVTFMISFFGGLCGSVMVIIIPSLLYLSLTGARFTSWKSLTILIGGGLLSVLTFISIIVNLIENF